MGNPTYPIVAPIALGCAVWLLATSPRWSRRARVAVSATAVAATIALVIGVLFLLTLAFRGLS